ncbi:AAA family ATPase [Nocardia puris]|nr:AAA family ATPase [Nocardia puris]
MVVTTDDHKLLRETLSKAFPTKSGPNIVLFAGVLTLDQRIQCLNTCREQKISAIVVDHAVAAFVAARYPRSFRAVQQITLPFTCFTHYTVIAGNVPDEVFVGRADELATLTDPTGSLFVYGGRQLGKSALLRKIQRDFNAEPDHRAIFIDLNSHGIGTWADSQRLWPVLYNELARIGGIDVKQNRAVRNPEPVIRAIQQWLGGKESRRLLLLLDEADAFLEKESSGSARSFENIGPLKGLFDDTQGRFKPIFAGLHKVQRLQNVANTPLAHGGRDVLIGPLAAKPASDLVRKPLEALGYRFENPEAVWRLLAFTNLQPGLIQVVCNDLISHLQSRPLHKGEPLVTIRDTDIDTVTQDPRTRDKIAEKLRLTIALEDRYRVIALAVAIMCMDDEFREKYTAADVREHCEMYWQQGFEDLNSAEFEVYLDELVGLGVLIKDRDGRFSVRSPNIVTMLGTKEQLETELDENKEQFELPHEYNPRSTRRQVTVSGHTVRSPLSEHDLSRLVPVKTKYEAANFAIVGSHALGVTDVARVLKSVGDERAIDVTVIDAAHSADIVFNLSQFKFAGSGSSVPRMLVVDASETPPQQTRALADAVRSMRGRAHGHLVVVLGASGLGAARALAENAHGTTTTVVQLGKWSGDGIRSWHDNPFNTPSDRRELLTHSGGWPELVERAVSDVSNRNISHSEEWARLSEFPEHEDAARAFLERVGVTDRDRSVLTPWLELGSASYERISDIAEVLESDFDEMNEIAVDLATLGVLDERHEEYAIDPVVARALNRLL